MLALGLMMLVNSCSGDRSDSAVEPANGKPGESTSSLNEFSRFYPIGNRLPPVAAGFGRGVPHAPGLVLNFDAKPQMSKDGSSLEVEMPVA